MFCKNCGKEIDDNAVVCPNCGVATDKFKEAAPAEAAVQTSQGGKTNVFAIIGFALSVIAFAFIFIQTIVFWIATAAALTLSILGLVWSLKKDSNLKGLAIAGIVISAVDAAVWLILLTVGLYLISAIL